MRKNSKAIETKTKSVLTKAELKKLLYVKTSKKQARTIKRRNVGLLKFLNSLPTTYEKYFKYDGIGEFTSNIGCPHCYSFNCRNCAWDSYDSKDGKGFRRIDYKCLGATFGGYNMTELRGGVTLDYAENEEYITVDEYKNFEEYIVALNRCKTFCQGHIEWANEVINKRH